VLNIGCREASENVCHSCKGQKTRLGETDTGPNMDNGNMPAGKSSVIGGPVVADIV